MKKLCSVVAAGAMVAASIVPALAADTQLGGEVRVRYQEDINKNGVDKNNSYVTTQRTRVNFKTEIDDQTTAFIMLQDSRTWGNEGGVSNTANGPESIDLSQGYLNIKNAIGPVNMKIGRQLLAYGNQRIIGGFEWHDSATRWDALKLNYKNETVDVDVFRAVGVENAGAGSDDVLNGIHVNLNVIPKNTLDIYRFGEVGANGLDRATMGVRIAGKAAGADWTAEIAAQSGDAANDVSAEGTMLAVTAGYTIAPAGNLRVGLEYADGSGDDGTDPTSDEAFRTIAATNHPHYGLHDNLVAGTPAGGEGNRVSNLNAQGVNVTVPKLGPVKLRAEYWMYTVNEEYVVGEDEYGTEMNVQLWYGLTEKVKLHAYHVIFTPGDGITAAPNDEEMTTSVIQLHAKF